MSGQDTPASLSRRTVRGAAWVAVEKWAGRVLSLLVFALLTRLLAPDMFGLAAIALSLTAIVQVFADNGLAQAIVQRRTLTDQDVHTAFWMSSGFSVVLLAAVSLAAPAVASFYDEPQLTLIIPTVAGSIVFAGLSSVPAALLERELQFKKLAVRRLVGATCGAVAAASIALAGGGIWALAAQPTVTGLVSMVTLWVSSRWFPRAIFSTGSLKALWGFSTQVMAIELLNAGQSNIDKFVVGAFFGADTLGYYFVAQRILMVINDAVSSILSKISLTTLSRLQDDDGRRLHYFQRMTFTSIVLAFPLFGVVVAFADPITTSVFGDGWQRSVPMMLLIAPSAMLAAVTFFDKALLLSRGDAAASLGVAAGQFVVGTAFIVAAAPIGILAVAAARSLRQFAFWPVRLLVLKRRAAVPLTSYLGQFVGPTLGVLAMIGTGLAFGLTPLASLPAPMLTLVLPGAVVALAAYVLVLRLTCWDKVLEVAATVRGTQPPAAARQG